MKSSKFISILFGIIALGLALYLLLQGKRSASFSTPAYDVGPFQVQVEIDPPSPQVGKNHVRVNVKNSDTEPPEGLSLHLQAEMPAMGSMPKMLSESEFKQLSPGVYSGILELSMQGTWNATLHLEDSHGQHSHLRFDFVTGKPGIRLSKTPHSEKEIENYTCPMHPSVRSDTPGACPICGMDLTKAATETSGRITLSVPESRQQLIGVTKEKVASKDIATSFVAVANVLHDETQLADITLKYNGWIGEVYADSPGKTIQKGDPLFTVYSPELVSAQTEFLEAASRLRGSETSPIAAAAKQRLLYWDLSEKQLARLREKRAVLSYVPITATHSGTIIEKNIVSGTAVKAGEVLYRISDLSKVWVEAELYDKEIALVSEGEAVSFTLPYLPGKTMRGDISFIYPYLFEKTRTGRVRIKVENPQNEIKPGAYSNVHFSIPLGKRLVIPKEAVIFAGEARVVFVDQGEGTLEARQVSLGVEAGPYYEVLDGVVEGESVVTSGNFLLASEAKIKLGIEKW